MKGSAATIAAACLAAWACGSLPDRSPTRPDPSSDPAPSPSVAPNPSPTPTPILGGAPPKASPSPSPTPEPSPAASPTPSPEGGTACGSPLPPELSTINVKIHLRGPNAWVLDSTPLVGPDVEYCAKIGFTDGRSFCPVRPEGNPEREACELYVTGRAADTGRPGPTWYRNGSFCAGSASGCDNHPDNQYLLLAYGDGLYKACGKNGVCGEVEVDR